MRNEMEAKVDFERRVDELRQKYNIDADTFIDGIYSFFLREYYDKEDIDDELEYLIKSYSESEVE